MADALDTAAFGLLCCALVWAPLALGSVVAWGLLGLRLLIIAAVVCWLLAVSLGKALILPRPASLAALAAYLGVVAIGAALSENAFTSREVALNQWAYGCGFLLASGVVTTPSRLRGVVGVLLATAAVLGAYGVLQYFGVSPTPTHQVDRISATYYNSNHYSGYLALHVPIAVALAWHVRRVSARCAFGALLAVLTFNLAMTFSWGLLATCAAIVGMVAFHGFRHHAWRTTVLAMGIAGAFGLIALITLIAYTPQLESETIGERAGEFFAVWVDRSLGGRLAIAQAVSRVAMTHPVVGVGPGNLVHALTRQRPPQVQGDSEGTLHMFVNYAHNDYLQVASETGLLGLLAFLSLFLLAVVRRNHEVDSPVHVGLGWALVALMLHGMTDGNMTVIPANALLGFTIAGALSAPMRLANHQGGSTTRMLPES